MGEVALGGASRTGSLGQVSLLHGYKRRAQARLFYVRHCERSEATQRPHARLWVATSPAAPRNDGREASPPLPRFPTPPIMFTIRMIVHIPNI